MRLWLLIVGGYFVFAGAALVLAPHGFKRFYARHVQNKPFRKWAVISLAFGLLLLWALPASQAPMLIWILAGMSLAKAVYLFLASRAHLNRVVEWWLKLPLIRLRLWGLVALVMGAAVLATTVR